MVLHPVTVQDRVLTLAHKALMVWFLLTFLTMCLNSSHTLCSCPLVPRCSSGGPEVVGHRSRTHQGYEWTGHPTHPREVQSSGWDIVYLGQMQTHNMGYLEQEEGLSTGSCLSKPGTAEKAISKGDDEYASLLLAIHQTSDSLAHPCIKPIICLPALVTTHT